MADPRLEQLAGLWVNGSSVAYKAAAMVRSDRSGAPPWSILVANASPAIVSDEMVIRLRTRDGLVFTGHAIRKGEMQTNVRTTLLEGTEPLALIGSPTD